MRRRRRQDPVRTRWLTVPPDPAKLLTSARWGASCPRQGNPPTQPSLRLAHTLRELRWASPCEGCPPKL
jgi:hypothetical protein